MREAVIVDGVRTAAGKGKPGGAFAGVHPVDLLAQTLQGLVERTGIEPAAIDDVLAGCVTQAREQAVNIARNAVLAAGWPESVPGTTIDRQCGSSQQAIHFAAQGVMAGAYDLVVAGGVESMGRVPMGTNAAGADAFGPAVAARYQGELVPQGIAAERIAARWRLSRQELDAFSATSHARAAAAQADGRFADELLPLKAPGPDGGLVVVDRDETIRPDTSLAGLAQLPPAFASDEVGARFPDIDEWRVTAGNSSPLTDGAAAVLLASRETADALGLPVRARVHTMAVTGDDPRMMLTAIIPATEQVLRRAGLTPDDIDLFEVNEAFASVVLAWQRETGIDLDRVNVHGGAIALGHPLGASGARILTTLLHALEQRDARYGLMTMCEAGGMANATIVERLG